jgi:hypothetical protein
MSDVVVDEIRRGPTPARSGGHVNTNAEIKALKQRGAHLEATLRVLGEAEQVFARTLQLTDWVRYLHDDLDDVSKRLDQIAQALGRLGYLGRLDQRPPSGVVTSSPTE